MKNFKNMKILIFFAKFELDIAWISINLKSMRLKIELEYRY